MLAKFKFLLVTSTLLLFYAFSCKTAEEIAQEQKVHKLDSEMQTSLQTNAQLVDRIKQLEMQLSKVTGKFEEDDYEKSKLVFGEMRKLQGKILVLEENNKNMADQLMKVQANQVQQKAFIDKVLKTLSSMNSGKGSSASKEVSRSPYQEAMYNYEKGRYSEAKPQLQDLIDKTKGNTQARVYHNLGMIAFMNKNNDEALIYFSKLYATHAKSPYTPNGLVYMGKALQRAGKVAEAKEAWSEIIKNFPTHRKAKEAKGLISKL